MKIKQKNDCKMATYRVDGKVDDCKMAIYRVDGKMAIYCKKKKNESRKEEKITSKKRMDFHHHNVDQDASHLQSERIEKYKRWKQQLQSENEKEVAKKHILLERVQLSGVKKREENYALARKQKKG